MQDTAYWHRVRAERCARAASVHYLQAAPEVPFFSFRPPLLLHLGRECLPSAILACGPSIAPGESVRVAGNFLVTWPKLQKHGRVSLPSDS